MRKNRCGWFVSFLELLWDFLFWRFIILYFRWSYVTAVATVGLQNGWVLEPVNTGECVEAVERWRTERIIKRKWKTVRGSKGSKKKGREGDLVTQRTDKESKTKVREVKERKGSRGVYQVDTVNEWSEHITLSEQLRSSWAWVVRRELIGLYRRT